MIKEVDLFGVFVPPLIAYAVLAALIWQPMRMVLERAGFYRAVWHPALFNLAAYAMTLAGVVALLK
ncbi:DUF1656 domain-containing protein [Chenggangzhangella methanolivorans]|uniref:DUF1656 domain-containing protein n=1 Tax=Chenggangzhangella methanolivorans TaxID=1437009 RepID=A0A9E6RDS2_9HYPH|nr:DUF1656 domain-containing protein [Chenggangzhangella methanolivorans]QZN98941.1 DUF1656 domain-containing protein [Chenggangzhangella methanolivorans]